MSVTTVAMDRAVALLRAAKVEFAIRLPDGTVVGDLPVAPPKVGRGGFKKLNNFEQDMHYISEVKAMKPGDVRRWTVHPDKAVAFQSALCGTAGRHHGAGNFITERVDPGTIEILLVDTNVSK